VIRIGFDPMPAALKASNKPGAAPSTRGSPALDCQDGVKDWIFRPITLDLIAGNPNPFRRLWF